jgi:MGT family glycosyltransferase
MRPLLVTLGSHGDIHPFIAIGRALLERGHRPMVATNPYFAAQIEAAGLPFLPFTERAELKQIIEEHDVMHPTRGPLNVLRKLTLPMVPAFVARMRELIRSERPDVVVYHPIVPGTPWACRLEGGLPTVSVTPSPTLWASPGDPLALLPFQSDAPGPRSAALARFLSRWVLRLALDPGLNRIRRQLGLPPERDHLVRHAREADLNLAVWSPVFRPPLPSDPPNSAVVGFPLHDRDHTQEGPDHELAAFLADGRPPIVFALGSTGVHAAGAFYRHAIEASRALGTPALLVIGRDQPAPSNLGEDRSIKAVAYAPYSAVFPRASVIVHHGGVGTTAQALIAGRPTLITPMAHDQFDNAARVRRLGAGQTLRFTRVTARRLVERLGPLLADRRFAEAAANLAPRIAAEDGATAAAARIERLARPANG